MFFVPVVGALELFDKLLGVLKNVVFRSPENGNCSGLLERNPCFALVESDTPFVLVGVVDG